jgi:hypothetical protein
MSVSFGVISMAAPRINITHGAQSPAAVGGVTYHADGTVRYVPLAVTHTPLDPASAPPPVVTVNITHGPRSPAHVAGNVYYD